MYPSFHGREVTPKQGLTLSNLQHTQDKSNRQIMHDQKFQHELALQSASVPGVHKCTQKEQITLESHLIASDILKRSFHIFKSLSQ